MDEQLQAVPDAELFGVASESCTDDIEDDLPFVCDQCNEVFKSLPWFTKHMEAGVHRAPAVSMKQFVAKHMQFHVGESKQVTSMHFKMERVDKDVDVVQAPAAMEGYVQNAIPS